MKHVVIILSIFIMICISSIVLSAVGSDYYTPLSIGNFVSLHSVSTLDPTGWARTTNYTFEGSDMIAGKLYYRERGVEIADPGQAWTSDTFRIFWLRKDSVGNLALGAIGNGNSTNINLATIISGGTIFPNEFLTKGYSRKDPNGSVTIQDSVVSTTETVTTTAGTFNNCIHIQTTQFNSTSTPIFREDQYYAYRIGMVQNYRSLPASQLHTDQLTAYSASGIIYTNQNQRGLTLFNTKLNLVNSSAKISFNVISSSFVSLNVFDLAGRNVASLVSEKLSAGNYSRQWNANGLANGVYFCRLQVGSFIDVQKIILHN